MKYKKINLSTNVFLLTQNIVSLSASYAFHDNFVGRVAGTYGLEGQFSGQVNVGVPIYFEKAYTGFFLEPGFLFSEDGGVYFAGGYHWMWDSGFNFYLGAGLARNGPIGYLQFGYAFW